MQLKYETEKIDCLSCGSSSYEEFVHAKDWISKTGESFHVVNCLKCGLKWTNPRVKQSDIGQFYPESYGPYSIGKATLTFGSISSGLFSNFVVSGYHIPKVNYQNKKVLELGCSGGVFLKKIQDLGAKAQGIEFSEYAANQAKEKGLDIHVGTLADFKSEETYDFVFAWMVMEHVYDPKKDFATIRSFLKPNGYLVFSVPNIKSFDFWLFSKYWYALQVPTHITHFDKKTVMKMLEDQGFKIVLITDQLSSTNYIFSLKNLLNDKQIFCFDGLINLFVYKKWFFPFRKFFDLICRLTNQSGRMTVWAQKIEEGDL
jgi:2-polyprenyl-3-methyl-5-hydroxy-6-metoxy-1,4-benzoquinol methylase